MTRGPQHWRAITRRNFLYLSGLAATGVVATACGGGGDELPGQTPRAVTPGAENTPGTGPSAQPTAAGQAPTSQTGPNPTAGANPAAAPTSFKEAPQFAEQVKAGQLPPVAERLPKKPLVVKPVERVGKYGGTWRTTILGPADSVWLSRTVGWENLLRWDIEWQQVIPNIAESIQKNPDGSEYTFTLREGLKWSDGAPVTADDVLFWWEDVTLNKELSPGGIPLFMRAGDKPGTIEKIDQMTFVAKFPQPHGLFMVNHAAGGISLYPKHYMQQFHKKYNTTNLDQLVQQHNAETWVKLFQTKGTSIPGQPYDAAWYNPERPTLNGWKLVQGFANTTRLTFERNPFYFKVDPEGNQLPYIDRVTFDIIQDREVMVLKATNGEIDLQDRNINTLNNKAVFTDNQQKGGYRFFETIPSNMNQAAITLNLTHKDPVKRQLFQNKDFRIGLSHAINRQEIIDVVFVSQGEPWQLAPRKETPWFNERLAKQYTEFDVAKANQFLDKVAPQKDSEGFRLGPDGKRISFTVEVTAGSPGAEAAPQALELVQGHWRKVGIEMQVKNEDRALLYTRKNANEHDAVVWAGDGGLKDALVEMRYYFPFSFESNFAQAWTAWYNPGGNPRTEKEEPPEAPKRQMALYEQIRVTPDEGKQVELVKQIMEIAADQFYAMGLALPPNSYGIVKNTMKNVPATMYFTGGPWLNPAATNPQQYFFQ